MDIIGASPDRHDNCDDYTPQRNGYNIPLQQEWHIEYPSTNDKQQ